MAIEIYDKIGKYYNILYYCIEKASYCDIIFVYYYRE